VLAVEYCHSKNTCHRDLKLENILINKYKTIKIIDFGFGIRCHAEQDLHMVCGTPTYMAPEIHKNSAYKGFKVDVWALGVIFYYLHNKCFPFKHHDVKKLEKMIIQGDYVLNDAFCPLGKDLVQKLLSKSAHDRPSCTQVLLKFRFYDTLTFNFDFLLIS
jgi:serine/threonine protein kinase